MFTSEDLLLVMRPYQIVATERILNRIQVATNYKNMGTIEAGGYIWHTTGSGKTLTSFKTAQLASKLEYIDKVLNILLSINREEYYINMAIAWTLADAYVDFKDKINDIIINKKLSPWVHNKTIQKICESFRISNEDKTYLKTLKIKK